MWRLANEYRGTVMTNGGQVKQVVADPRSELPDPPSELQKLEFDYAWKWFNFHADQRIKMFNFMLIVFGIFATAIVTALDKPRLSREITVGLCVIAGVLALIFSRLDRRNRDLLWLGEDVLVELERKGIFGEDNEIDGRRIKTNGREEDRKVRFGILWRQKAEERENPTGDIGSAIRGKHRLWLPWISYLFAVLFFIAAAFIWKQGPQPPGTGPSTTVPTPTTSR
jgi:hypothetical protein